MKYTFDKNKINIFTIIPYSMREDPVRKACMESWKKIPNANIYLFDAATDIRDTFPGMLENDKYYQLMNNNNKDEIDKNGNVVMHESYDAYYDEKTDNIVYKVLGGHSNKEGCFSFDSIRLKMLQEIPNAFYIDSDIYVFNIDIFVKICKNDEFKKLDWRGTNIMWSKNKSYFLDKMIEFYDNELKEHVLWDYAADTVFLEKYSKRDRLIEKLGNTCYNVFYTHFFYTKYQVKDYNILEYIDLINKSKESNNLCLNLFVWDTNKYSYDTNYNLEIKDKFRRLLDSLDYSKHNFIIGRRSLIWEYNDVVREHGLSDRNFIVIDNIETLYNSYKFDELVSYIKLMMVDVYTFDKDMMETTDIKLYLVD